MPRPKPDKIVRHQIVFGEADRKIISAAVDSYNFNTIMGNATKILNDVTGTITLLTLLSVSGILGVVFAFQINPIHLATGNIPEIMKDFGFQWDEAAARAGDKNREEQDARRAEMAQKIAADPLGFASDVSNNPVLKIADFLFGKDSGAANMNQNFGSGSTYDSEEGLKFN